MITIKIDNKEMNLADHGVRKYDSDLGRFLCPDAMWEKYISYTPYQYSLNNPISNIDWDGKVVQGGAAVAAGGYIGIATWAISEIQNPGSTAGLGRVLETSFSNAVSDVKGLFSTPDYSVKGNVSIYPAQDALVVKPVIEMAEHTSKARPSTSDKHTKTRSGTEYGRNRNENRGDKNKKYEKPKNPNKKREEIEIIIDSNNNKNDINNSEKNNE